MEEDYDLVVVGGGVYGLPMIKTYLEVNPTAHVLLLDAGASIGGTWSAERVYPGLYTNNQVGTFEYADFPMAREIYGVRAGSHVPGEVAHKYLCDYVEHFGFGDRIRLRASVSSVELRDDGSWLVRYEWKGLKQAGEDAQLVARKLVLATGTTSEPFVPQISGMDTFGGPLFHFKELSKHADEMAVAKSVVVLGGAKAAADAVYMSASQGIHVDWVIRATGKGPTWFSYPLVSPAKLLFERITTIRCFSFISPSFELDAYPTIRKLLHNTRLGRAFLRGLFAVIGADVTGRSGYNDHPETKKLKPRSNIYWWGSAVSILNYSTELFGLVRSGIIHVHIADVDSISANTVHLSDGKDVSADVFVCATGWKQTQMIKILPEAVAIKSGVSNVPPTDDTVKAADAEIMRRFPELRDQPPAGRNGLLDREQTSYKLYRGAVPPAFLSSHNLAYCGMAVTLRGFLTAQIQALWITAFLDARLSSPLPSEEEAEWQALLQTRFWRWRSPNGLGPKSPDMVFEILPFFDTLLRDLGLRTARKPRWWREMFEYYGVGDYRGLVGEWLGEERERERERGKRKGNGKEKENGNVEKLS